MTRPNIILIISDQLRRQALGCYGDPNVSTPNIDALAASGTRFTAASSTYPVCVPFRFSLMTGEYAHTRFIPSIEWRMSPAERTLADEFNEADYRTALFGKWHLYGNFGHYPGHNVVKASRTPVPRPFQGRFQHFAGFDICNDPYDTWYSTHDDPTMRKIEGYQTDGLFDLAIDYATGGPAGATGAGSATGDGTAGQREPFAAVLSVEPPHPLFTAPPEYLDRWRDRELVLRDNVEVDKEYRKRGPHGRDLLDDLRVYYAMIENLDDNVGRLVAALRASGQLDNTIIALTADHGELLGCHGVLAKQRPWEESIGIPLIIGNVGGGGRTVADPVCTEDLFPTLLGLAGITPRDPKPGLNLAPVARGQAEGLDRDAVLLEFVAEMRPEVPFHEETWRGIRTRRHKYTVLGDAHGGKPWQFFDLESDPYELTNLVDDPDHADLVKQHHELLRARLAESYDHYVLAPAFGCPGLNTWDPKAEHQKRFG
ncbi:sulfatase [Plantactinospora sp. KBS50]|uniref:sulfatase family protein n=1 Tax=Plantactinospora sp. KBS50 TaxID=2024580 RepID=UPI0012FE0617|nr:sulfatase [Plantactinospora sp. KBS50]